MNRSEFLEQVENFNDYWDVVVIGGGATGLGVGVDAASRGYKTLLLEMHDFAKGTSSRSTKLVHGGVRYLQQGDVSLVIEALHERGLLIQNAPHLVSHQSFIVPSYEWWNGPFYGVGLKVYDALAGKLGINKSKNLSKKETLEKIPTLESKDLRGGVIYYDGQFDDSRLSVNLAQTIHDQGGVPLNYMKVTGLSKNNNGLIDGVKARDMLNGKSHEINARVVINATGIFTDEILDMDEADHERLIQCAQGIHLVLDKEFLPGESAIMVPHTDDGRVLFAVPWHNKVIVGTTDTPIEKPTLEPVAQEEEIDFVLRHAAQYLTKNPTRKDVKSVFAGLRPLVKPPESSKTSEISRSHHLQVSESGLVTITGGKWTTYRKMAEDTMDRAAMVAGLEVEECPTKELRIHGWLKNVDRDDHLYVYGSDRVALKHLLDEQPELAEKIHPDLPYLKGEVIWAVRNEMAQTIEDFLARRTRALLLDAKASIEMAEEVGRLMAQEFGKDESWVQQEVKEYKQVAKNYMIG
ncbi:glycerol-3-phosphate dehydrogenase/oxidase [Gracilimonas mengyeensis]|uniref:Glycerol-3-phosphate dehydrogenase n=1 Tax=Gracilimonas mengyeensis TaxID=1302730 RepID=A0A521CNJ7_9BACT|nr:glycerol-3-phosphate dehydrogenase/oxidase [Gracilimonas mengyeensis]SMO60968.1 glycerol-3-phosphate dehydrogenase [Gracilimonas mengyeensis]